MITVILNCYRRPQNLEEQIKAIRSQTVAPKEIWLWVNNHPDNQHIFNANMDVDKVIWSSHNFKFHGRFSAAVLAETPYVALFDDDTIPGPRWFENCLATVDALKAHTTNPILGSAGVRLHSSTYINHTRVGWPSQNVNIEEVDLVGHAWFIPSIAIRSLWAYPQISLENAEDIQLSYHAQKAHGIRTFVPPHPISNKDMWGSIKAEQLGVDDVAMSNGKVIPHNQFFAQRDFVIEKAIESGWKPLFKTHAN